MANQRFARFTAQTEIVLYFYKEQEKPELGTLERFQSQAEIVLYFYSHRWGSLK